MGLYISLVTASKDLLESPINAAVTHLAISVAMQKRLGLIPEGPSLDVTFMLPGKSDKPKFTGMRMGGYSQESNTLFFERSVPEHILKSSNARHYLAMVMQDVVTHASTFFEENAMAFNAPLWRQVMEQITEVDTSVQVIH